MVVAESFFFRAESEGIPTNASQDTRKCIGGSLAHDIPTRTIATSSRLRPTWYLQRSPHLGNRDRTMEVKLYAKHMLSKVQRLCVPTLLGRSLGFQRDMQATKYQCEAEPRTLCRER